MDKIQELVYISPNEAEFLGYHLILMYFDKNAQFQTNLQKIYRDHPEVISTVQFTRVLSVISMLNNNNQAQLIRLIETSDDIILCHLICFPDFFNTVRLKYFEIMKAFSKHNFPDQNGTSIMMVEERSVFGWGEMKRRLLIDTDEEMKLFIAFCFGKKSAGLDLYSIEKDHIYMDLFKVPYSVLKDKVSKIRPMKTVKSLLDKLSTADGRIKRETLIKKTVKGDSNKFTEQVLKNCLVKVGRFQEGLIEYSQDEQDNSRDERPEPIKIVKPVSIEPKRPVLEKITAVVMPKQEAVVSKPAERIPVPEETIRRLERKKANRVMKRVLDEWSGYLRQKKRQGNKIVEEMEEQRMDRLKINFFYEWKSFISQKKARIEDLLMAEPFPGTIHEVETDVIYNHLFLKNYASGQTFMSAFTQHIVQTHRAFIGKDIPQLALFKDIKLMEISWLFIIDSNKHLDELLSFFSIFMIDQEDVLPLFMGQAFERDYLLPDPADSEGRPIEGGSIFRISFKIKRAKEVTASDLQNNLICIYYATDAKAEAWMESKYESLRAQVEHCVEEKTSHQSNLYFSDYKDLMSFGRKTLIKIKPFVEANKVNITTEDCPINGITWHSFNRELNHVSYTAYLRVVLFSLQNTYLSLEHLLTNPELESVKLLEESAEVDVIQVLTNLKLSLDYLSLMKEQIKSGGLQCSKDFMANYVEKCSLKDVEGFISVRNLVLRIIFEMQCENYEKYKNEDDPSHMFLLELVNTLQNSSFINELPSNRWSFLLFNYVHEMIMAPIKAAQYAVGPLTAGVNFKTLEKDTQRKVWDSLVGRVESNNEEQLVADWMPFFSEILGIVLDLLKQFKLQLKVTLLHDFTQNMFSDIDYERLADLGSEEIQEIQEAFEFKRQVRNDSQCLPGDREEEVLENTIWMWNTECKSTLVPEEGLGKRSAPILFSHSSFDFSGINKILKV